MEQVLNPEQAAAPASEYETPGLFHVVAHIVLFAGFGLVLKLVGELAGVYDDTGFLAEELHGIAGGAMVLNRFFVSIHIPLWTLSVVALAVDLAVWRTLRRKGRFLGAHLWMWLVPVGVVTISVVLIVSIFLPLVGSINSRQ
ncbi:MAG: hypothetical protein FD180_2410 [Planctomycetota bacterium]|nr:MAG: hypothetical protein FD180_2410 [Planctomycetota bacterium]